MGILIVPFVAMAVAASGAGPVSATTPTMAGVSIGASLLA